MIKSESLMLAIFIYSLIAFISTLITFSTTDGRKIKNIYYFLSYWSLVVSLLFINIEINMISIGKNAYAYTYLAYSSLAFSLILYADVIQDTTGISASKITKVTIYSIVVGILFSFFTTYDDIVITTFISLLTFSFPFHRVAVKIW